MPPAANFNPPALEPGDRVGAYRLLRKADLPLMDAVFYQLEHAATGARHIHIGCADTENTFGVVFKTVPRDSTGVAHILEHTVLCGSRNYPVRDPFFSMIKRSLSTFMNAFTASDWTMYPYCTQNRKDYYNLMGVYLDSVFYPNLDELSFKQEGHRLEFTTDEPVTLAYKGVVYNEMKGAMSSPDEVFARSLLNAIYPDTTYQYNSGGDPAVIPQLTHAQLQAFHRRHYHPSNAFFYTYGNLPLADHLDFIQTRVLENFERIDPQTEVPIQPRWQQPRQKTCYYPLDPREDTARKSQVALAWITGDVQDAFGGLTLTLLEQLLLGNSASPLRKALMDSELGSALCDASGYQGDQRDTFFACGLKDVEPSSSQEIADLILRELKTLTSHGIERELIASAIHQFEFHRREVTNTPYPYGLRQLLTFCGPWLHGADPLNILRFDSDLERLRRAVAEGPFFEQTLQRLFLDNPHRVLFVLEPDPQMAQREEARLAAELTDLHGRLDSRQMDRIRKDSEQLDKLQSAAEDLSTLPTLSIDDISPGVQTVDPHPGRRTTTTLHYPQSTSGILYLAAATEIERLEARLIPLLPLFCHTFTRMGTESSDYTRLVRRIDAHTGGIGLSPQAQTRYDQKAECYPFLTLNAKCLERKREKLFEILSELMREFSYGDHQRLKSLLLEYKAGLESMVIHNGHRLAMSLAARSFSTTGALGETWHGIHQLKAIKALGENTDAGDLDALAGDLGAIGKAVLNQSNLQLALVGRAETLQRAQTPVDSLLQDLPPQGAQGDAPRVAHWSTNQADPDGREASSRREGWSTTAAVAFVARVFPTVKHHHPDAPVLAVISKMLRSLYLHREIREKGGAYGGFALYKPEEGLFCLASYRDPHIVNTLEVFDQAGDFICSGKYGPTDVTEAILQICSEIDKPDPPALAARKAFYRRLVGLSDEARQDFKTRLLATTHERVVETARNYFNDTQTPQAVAVIGAQERLEAANARLGENPLDLHRI